MTNLIEFQKGLQALGKDNHVIKLLFDAIRQTEKTAIGLQKSQLADGRNNKDQLIGVYSQASEEYAKFSNPRKPKIAGEPYNFEDTGSFLDNVYLIYDGENVLFYSKDSKTELLIDKYENLFGLDDYNLGNYLKNSILPLLIVQIKTTLKIN